MAAANTDKITYTASTTTVRPQPTQVTSTRSAGVFTLACNALTGWPTNTQTKVHFCTYKLTTAGAKIAGSQIDMEGIVSGTSIGSIVIRGGSDVGNAIGDIVEMAPTGAWGYDLATGLLSSHNPDGTIKDNGIATASQITDGILTDAKMTTAIKPVTLFNENTFDHVVSGCIWTADAAGSTRNASMTSGVIMLAGKRLTVAAVTARSFTASKDVYVDFSDNGDGTALITYTDNITNTASPVLTAGSLRNAIVVVGAANIATAASINQGQEDRILPIASSIPYTVTDSLGNLICSRDPQRRVLGYRQIVSSFSTSSTTATQVTGLTAPVIVPTGRKVKITTYVAEMSTNTTANNAVMGIWDGTVGSGTKLQDLSTFISSTATISIGGTASVISSPTAGLKTYNASFHVTAGTGNFACGTTRPAFVLVELV